MNQETRPLFSTVRSNDRNENVEVDRVRCGGLCSNLRHVCLHHKAILLILAWTMIVGELLMLQQAGIKAFIDNYVPVGKNHFVNSVSSPLAFVYAILAVIAMFYPLSGFLADVCCGRFKTVMVGLSFLLFTLVVLVAAIVWATTKHAHRLLELDPLKELAPFYVIFFGALSLVVLGAVAFQANIIQLGLDQLMDASSEKLSVFVHLAIWADTAGAAIVINSLAFAETHCPTIPIIVRIVCFIVPLLPFLCFPFLIILACCKRQWFYTEPGHRNPYKNVLQVLNFARKFKYYSVLNPRSAFTYCDDERPSRIDFAKSRYGGPFTTEQVEDVKTFLRILKLLVSLGAVFVIENPTSFVVFNIFGAHTGHKEDFISHCTVWAILETGALRYTIGSIFLPFYIYKVLRGRQTSIFTRLYVGLLFYILGTVSMLAIDLAGHLHSVNDQGTGSHCMFSYTRAGNGDVLRYPILEMHWGVLIPPNFLLGIGAPVVMATIFEFISAQSPHSMKGLLIGVFFAIRGFFQLISSIALVPISSDSIWSKGSVREHPPVTNCCFTYFLFIIVAALFGIVAFSIVIKRYKYRERDDRPYDQSVVEEIFHQRTLMRSQSLDYDNLDACS